MFVRVLVRGILRDMMQPKKQIERTALAVTRWIGSPISLTLHTLFFIGCFFAVRLGYIAWDEMLLLLTTIVSLEAIYLSLFIQMTINYTTETVEDISEDVVEMQEDIGEIQEDVDEIQEDVDELQEDVEDIEESDDADATRKAEQQKTLATIQTDLRKLMIDIDRLQKNNQPPTGR